MVETKIVITLNENANPVLVAQIIELAKIANGEIVGPTDPPTDPPAEFYWTNNSTMEQAVDVVNGWKASYVRVKEGAFLWMPDKQNVLTPSQPSEFGDTMTARTKFKRGQILLVVREPSYTKPGADAPDEKIYRIDGLEHITNIKSEKRPFPIAFNGGERAFVVGWEQRIDGHDIASHPDRLRPLVVRAEDVIEVMEF